MWDKKVVYFVCILTHTLFVETLAGKQRRSSAGLIDANGILCAKLYPGTYMINLYSLFF